MSLTQTIADALTAGFQALDDIVIDATYKTYTAGASDGAGGFLSPTWTDKNIKGIQGKYSTQEVFMSGGLISPNDQKFMVLQSVIGKEPSTNDLISIGSKSYQILGSIIDPAGAMYTIHLREQV